VMQAPCLIQSRPERSVVLPAGDWFDAVAGRWRRGGRRCRVKDEFYSTPLYVRVDSAIPMQRGLRSKQHNDLSDIELHVFLRGGQAELKYEFDDGLGYGYRRAQRTRLSGCCWRERRAVQLRLDQVDIGYRPCRIRVVSYGPERELVVVERGCSRRSSLEPARWNMAGAQLQVRVSRPWIPEPTG
jgi:hypothetical protein